MNLKIIYETLRKSPPRHTCLLHQNDPRNKLPPSIISIYGEPPWTNNFYKNFYQFSAYFQSILGLKCLQFFFKPDYFKPIINPYNIWFWGSVVQIASKLEHFWFFIIKIKNYMSTYVPAKNFYENSDFDFDFEN